MQNSFRIARIGGIDILINWTWLFAVAFITYSLGMYYHTQFPEWGSRTPYIVGAVSAVLLFVTVLIHELAHSFVARANGLPVRQIYLFIFGGVSNLPQEPESARTELLVAIAGPLASLVLAGLFYVLHTLASGPSEVGAVLGYLASINLILALFNLIPGFPLDGGRVLRSIIWMISGNQRSATKIASTVGNGIGYLFILGGLFDAFILHQFASGIWLAFIGWFLHNAASQSYQHAVMDRVLSGVEVRNVMDPIGQTAGPDMPIEALVYRHMLSANQRAVPVVSFDGSLLGLVTLADTRKAEQNEWNLVPVSRVMAPADELCTVTPDDTLQDALRILAENDYHQLPVMRDGRLVGMLDRGHVLEYLHVRQRLAATQPKSDADTDSTGAEPPRPAAS